MATSVVITPNAGNGTVEFKRMNGATLLQAILLSTCFQIDWNKSANENMFDVFSGDNHFIIEYREVSKITYPTTQDFYDYLVSIASCEGSSGGGSLPSGASTEAKQNSEITELVAIKNAIFAAKDGEFNLFTDPNDNNRLVGLSIDLTNPAVPIYVYTYLDDNTPYTGNIADLDTSNESVLLAIASSIDDVSTNTNDISTKIENNDSEVGSLSNKLDVIKNSLDTSLIEEVTYSTLVGLFANGENLTGNTVGSIGQIIYDNATNLLKVKSSTIIPNGEVITGGTSGATATVTASVILAPSYAAQVTNRQDTTNSLLEKKNIGRSLDLTASSSDPWGGYPFTLIDPTSGSSISFASSQNGNVNFSIGETIDNVNDLVSALNKIQGLIVFSAINATTLNLSDGVWSVDELTLVDITANEGNFAYATFVNLPNVPTSNLDVISENVKQANAISKNTSKFFEKKNIGKIIDLTTADSSAWQGYPLVLATYPAYAFAFDLDIQHSIVQSANSDLIANNANELASILNSLQSFFVFSVIDDTKLLINDGVYSLSSFDGYFYIATSNFGTLLYDATLFTDSTDATLSNLDEIKEQLKTLTANVKALAKLTDTQPVWATPNLLQEIQMTGQWRGKTAYAFNLIGQRNGFTNTSVLQGVKEYDNGVADFAVTSNSTLDIISSSANDILAGTGVRSVNVVYINNAGNLIETSVVMNGTTLSTSVLTGVQQVLWMEAFEVGSGGVAAGNIRLRINGGSVEVEQITAGSNKSRSAIFQVPNNYTAYIANWRVSAVNNDQDVRLTATVNTLDRSINATAYHYVSEKYATANSNIPPQDIWLKLPSLSRIKARTMSGGTAATVRCNVNLLIILIEN